MAQFVGQLIFKLMTLTLVFSLQEIRFNTELAMQIARWLIARYFNLLYSVYNIAYIIYSI